MSASAAVIYPTTLKLGAEAMAFEDRDNLEDVFVTDVDGDLTPVPGGRRSKPDLSKAASSLLAASITQEWLKLQQSRGRGGSPMDANPQQLDVLVAEEEDAAAVNVVKTQPKRLSQADVLLQPSQVEEMLGQNSLLLGGRAAGDEGKPVNSDSESAGSSSLQYGEPQPVRPSPATSLATARSRRSTFWDGFISCINPIMGSFKKEKRPLAENIDKWEVPFADIRELDFIGSGSQGAVFVGEYLKEKVAVKKVKDVIYCREARHLRKLRHPNIVKFK